MTSVSEFSDSDQVSDMRDGSESDGFLIINPLRRPESLEVVDSLGE